MNGREGIISWTDSIGRTYIIFLLSISDDIYLSTHTQVELLEDLIELDLRKNQIQEVPLELAKCTRLTKLHLGDNKVAMPTYPPTCLPTYLPML